MLPFRMRMVGTIVAAAFLLIASPDHGLGSAGMQAPRYISRTVFPGSTELHRLRAVDRASYIRALPAEAATITRERLHGTSTAC